MGRTYVDGFPRQLEMRVTIPVILWEFFILNFYLTAFFFFFFALFSDPHPTHDKREKKKKKTLSPEFLDLCMHAHT